jgi:hypothetical protein
MLVREPIEVQRVYRRTGFRPCCEKHVEYRPCDCPKFAAELADGTVLTFETEEQAKALSGAYRMKNMTIEEMQERLAEEVARGDAARLADIEAKVARRKKLGLSLFCTADELDATPMEEEVGDT